MKNIGSRQIVLYGILAAAALILGYVESLIQLPAFIPGMKLGLPNLAVIAALYLIDIKSAIIINLVRILLSGILFGNIMSLAYSLSGGALSLIVMILLSRKDRFSIIAVSIAGGICHNIGQMLVAIFVLQTKALAWYFLILWFAGIISGALIGLLAGIIVSRLKKTKIFQVKK